MMEAAAPYKDEDMWLCATCGACVDRCPRAAITGKHFTTEQIIAEIEGVLA